MNTYPYLYPNLPETQEKIAETSLGTVGGVLKVTSKNANFMPRGPYLRLTQGLKIQKLALILIRALLCYPNILEIPTK